MNTSVILKTNVGCPYCGTTNYINVREPIQQVLISCDVDNGGCNRDFVVKTHLTAENIVRPLLDEKIDSEKQESKEDLPF